MGSRPEETLCDIPIAIGPPSVIIARTEIANSASKDFQGETTANDMSKINTVDWCETTWSGEYSMNEYFMTVFMFISLCISSHNLLRLDVCGRRVDCVDFITITMAGMIYLCNTFRGPTVAKPPLIFSKI